MDLTLAVLFPMVANVDIDNPCRWWTNRLSACRNWTTAPGPQRAGRDERRLGTPRSSSDLRLPTSSSSSTTAASVPRRTTAPFDIDQLADDTARMIEALEFERASVLGWSLGGFIAQTLALDYSALVDRLILLSTDPGGADAELASPDVRSRLADMSGTPHEQARRLLSLLFPGDLAEPIYQKFGDLVAAARAQLSPDLIRRQVTAMDAWHWDGTGDRLAKVSAPALVAAGTEDIVIPASNALPLVNAIPGAWLAQFKGGAHAFHSAVSTPPRRSHQWVPCH